MQYCAESWEAPFEDVPEVWLGRTESGWVVAYEDGSVARFDHYAQTQLNDAFSARAELKALRKVVSELQEIVESVLEDDGYCRNDFECGAYFAYQRVARVLKG